MEENSNYILQADAINHDNGFTNNDYLTRSVVIDTFHPSAKSSFVPRQLWQSHRGGRSALHKSQNAQPKSPGFVDDPNWPTLLMHQSKWHSSRPGSSCDSRTTSPEPFTRQHRQLQSRSTTGHSRSPDHIPYYHSPLLVSNKPHLPSSKSSTHTSYSASKVTGMANPSSSSFNDTNQAHLKSSSTTFPGLVSRSMRPKSFQNSIDIVIDTYKVNPKLTVINPSFL